MADVVSTGFYAPDRVDGFYRRWGEIEAMAEFLSSPGNLEEGGHRIYSKGRCGDPLRWADVVADLENATARLDSMLGNRLIDAVKGGCGPSAMARVLGQRKADVLQSYRDAIGWVSRMLEPNGSAC